MHGHQQPSGSGSGHRHRRGGQPPPQQQIYHIPNIFVNPNFYPHQQIPNVFPHFNPFLANPNMCPQHQQTFPNFDFPVQMIPDDDNIQTLLNNGNIKREFPQRHVTARNEMIEKVDKALRRARAEILASNENISGWKVSQAALMMLKVESWESLGFQMQQVPSLNELFAMEGKINAFINCFVAVRRITTLHDLEIAICESEGLERFEELELGPMVRHPLAVHYFSLSSNITEVHRIKTEEIISYLHEFISTHRNRELEVGTFLDFITKKKLATSWEKLCIRIQNFRSYVNHIKQVMQSEDRLLEKNSEKIRMIYHRSKSIPPFSASKKEIDDRFSSISNRIKSFSSARAQYCGTHVRFASSSSEYDDIEGKSDPDMEDADRNCSMPVPNIDVSSCPYPSATEEITRLAFKSADSSTCLHSGGIKDTADNELSHREMGSTSSLSRKQLKRTESKAVRKRKRGFIGSPSFSSESLQIFIKTWMEACKTSSAEQVFLKMLRFYKTKGKRKVIQLFSSYPYNGLLHAAVACIKFGIPDINPQTLSQQDKDARSLGSMDDLNSVGEQPATKAAGISAPGNLKEKPDVGVEDILKKISGHFDDEILRQKDLSRERRLHFLKKLCKSENWLIEEYYVDKFESLGHGEYSMFLEKYMYLLPHELQKFMIGDVSKGVNLEAHLLQIQLDALLSQALSSSCRNEKISLQTITSLLAKQYPLAGFKLVNGDVIENSTANLLETRCNSTSSCILFSSPLLEPSDKGCPLTPNQEKMAETCDSTYNAVNEERLITSVTTTDAIRAMLNAPMLTDLFLWLHWDVLFGPSLGSIVEWLLKKVNTRDLLCLVTRDGKIIRLNHLATVDSFLNVFIQGSSFGTAVDLLSLFALYGGQHGVPLSLLKSHAQKAFEVLISNFMEMELNVDMKTLQFRSPSYGQDTVLNSISSDSVRKSVHISTLSKVAPVVSRFILDCLSYLPIEFCSFATDVLISGLQTFVTNVPKVILTECGNIQERLMLHEVGMSLGIMEWTQDHHSFSSSALAGSFLGSSCLTVLKSDLKTNSMCEKDDPTNHFSSTGETFVPFDEQRVDLNSKEVSMRADSSAKRLIDVDSQRIAIKTSNVFGDDPSRVIECIRQEEFGLDQCHSATDNRMLEKQHARLGRALRCLSQELYSHDSHFLLELVQNADDNMYPENVVPTLVFVLQEKSIIVLNNERGFSARDIRALCDVGSSTKRTDKAGYIGKKGIGFKSVFRVTDAPEIHSNGFHIKFDITKGQIGFVLPTVVPPCDIDLYSRLACTDADCIDQNSWKTCIVLPFRSSSSQIFEQNSILSMFSDLHPSLLLFLHRLRCIKFRNILDDTYTVMRKKVRGDGIVEVSVGDDKMTWLVVSHQLKADVIHSEMRTTEISLAFTLHEMNQGGYAPVLNQQPVFAFLPLRTYGLKFILQGDFILPSSREEVDGNSPLNQWLLSEVPDLFVRAGRSFCNLPCYKKNPGKAVTLFMNFVPIVGEVHGFFSSLPRMIISKLRMSNCLLLEGVEKEWAPPCKAMRNWTDQARSLLPDSLLQKHLGLGFLDKDIVLSDSLARSLGVEDYGPKLLFRVLSSLCCVDNGLNSMGLVWLSSWLSATHMMLSQFSSRTSSSFEDENEFLMDLQKIPFIPLSNGKYASLDQDVIWLYDYVLGQSTKDACCLDDFPFLLANLRLVSPNLLAAASSAESSCSSTTTLESVMGMLHKVGVQRLSAHDILKMHVLPAISNDRNAVGQDELMIEYLAFAMFHLQSSCTACGLERCAIIAELRLKALVLTNYGYKRLSELPIHLSPEYGNPVDINKLISGFDMKWHEIDSAYLKHPITQSTSDGFLKWRIFFKDIGASDFVQVVQVEKKVPDTLFTNLVGVKDVISANSVVKDWESEELSFLLSLLSSRDDGQRSMYLLEFLDKLWDDTFGDKITCYCISPTGESKPLIKSSFIRILQDYQWMCSTMSSKLNYPKELYHDCSAVKSILGVSAPYAIPKVGCEKLIVEIGLKTKVTLDDALSVLRLWRQAGAPLEASVSQMSDFYTFIWKGMVISKKKVLEELHEGPFIFIPNTSDCPHEDVVPGVLLPPEEVHWHDVMRLVDQSVVQTSSESQTKTLCGLYPRLHDFFVHECGVEEHPPFCSYLQALQQLSNIALPHEAVKRVFEVFLIWADALKSGSLSYQDLEYLKENFQKKSCTVLPTRQDKWVSLHSSFGLICWCDDDTLGREFKNLKDVDFIYFGGSTIEENRMIQGNVSTLMRRLGIPFLSEIATREAIYYGPSNCSFIHNLVDWVLPYAQRYIYNAHPEKYIILKESGFDTPRHLKIAVVEKLFYRNVIERCGISSMKRHETDCLHQGNILYCTRQSDPHSIFLELSSLLYSETPDVHFANFLDMITTKAESGATEEQTEIFVANSQKLPKLPAEESSWSLQPVSSFENDGTESESSVSIKDEDQSYFLPRRTGISSNWPPVGWKTAPGFRSATAFTSVKQESSSLNVIEGALEEKDLLQQPDTEANPTHATVFRESEIKIPESKSNILGTNVVFDSVDLAAPDSTNSQQALLTGRLGELVAYKYFMGKEDEASVKWVNEGNETGLPYDIIIADESRTEYIEVKATRSASKIWFFISTREWEFAIERGESYTIAHVVLANNSMSKITIYKNPARLWRLGNLKLAALPTE